MVAPVIVILLWPIESPAANDANGAKRYLGFDRNEYPGDALLPQLRKDFAYTGYWLNAPPNSASNSWSGKRNLLRSEGFGFLILFNGRLDAELKGKDPAALGGADAQTAISSATKEGFPAGALIFLDQEEGGRLLPEQSAYLFSWIDAIRKLSRFRVGVYCSGIQVPDGSATISTAEDIRSQEKNRGALPIALWVAQDECPPSPGCAVPHQLPSPNQSGVAAARVWQYTQSPRRQQFTRRCVKTYAADGNCYAPGIPQNGNTFLDLNVSGSADPSSGR